MNTLLHEYHARLGAALEGDNRLAAIELLHAEMQARIAALEPEVQADHDVAAFAGRLTRDESMAEIVRPRAREEADYV